MVLQLPVWAVIVLSTVGVVGGGFVAMELLEPEVAVGPVGGWYTATTLDCESAPWDSREWESMAYTQEYNENMAPRPDTAQRDINDDDLEMFKAFLGERNEVVGASAKTGFTSAQGDDLCRDTSWSIQVNGEFTPPSNSESFLVYGEKTDSYWHYSALAHGVRAFSGDFSNMQPLERN